MFYLDSYQIKVNFAEDTIFKMEFALVEFKLNVQALLYSDFHFDWSISVWLFSFIRDNKLLLFCNTIVIPIDDYIDVVPQSNDYSIVCFKLFFYAVELKVIRHVLYESTWWLQIPYDLQEYWVLVLVIQVLDDANKLNSDSQMVYPFCLVQRDTHLTLDIFTILPTQEM